MTHLSEFWLDTIHIQVIMIHVAGLAGPQPIQVPVIVVVCNKKKNIYLSKKETGCLFVCMFVAKDFINPLTEMVYLFSFLKIHIYFGKCYSNPSQEKSPREKIHFLPLIFLRFPIET